jgi:hypothetical protein
MKSVHVYDDESVDSGYSVPLEDLEEYDIKVMCTGHVKSLPVYKKE